MRPIWSGAIAFGLVTIPIRLYTATTSKSPRFRQLRKSDHSPIRYRKVAQADGIEVPKEEIVRGFEFDKGQYVVLTDEEIASAAYQGGPRIVDIAAFVGSQEIDPVYYRTSYYLEPGETGEKAYAILRTALADTGRVGLGTVALRSRQQLAAIRARDDLLVLETMYWPDEVRSADLSNLGPAAEMREGEVAMAKMLIENLSSEFEPSGWTDSTREKIDDMVRRKIEGKEVVAPESPTATRVVDLLEALKASVEATRGQTEHRQAV